jgi:hypothetical protein
MIIDVCVWWGADLSVKWADIEEEKGVGGGGVRHEQGVWTLTAPTERLSLAPLHTL